ncbi:ATP synthase subunit s, mitochondrial isoform X1 [Rhinolophus sinicus]|uniref:ATP synthase subunit s, mitochondrial isoform X1 n=1 Tax=Rhinolophus sinicus TaxID=89399 RepID=UPI003D79176B
MDARGGGRRAGLALPQTSGVLTCSLRSTLKRNQETEIGVTCPITIERQVSHQLYWHKSTDFEVVKVDYDRIRDVGPDRAASEWLLRCGAMVRYHGQERWQNDYNNLPTGPLNKYKIQAIDATDSCIMSIGFDHMEGLQHVEKIRLCKCHYIEDDCLERLGQLENLQKSMLEMEIISCGNVTDRGIIALHHLRKLKYLLLSDLPGIRDKENLVQAFKTALPSLELKLDLK